MTKSVKMDERVKEVLKLIKNGSSRKDISKEYGYSSYRSLDQYMRRRGFHWSSEREIYEPKDSNKKDYTKDVSDSKILRILSKFDTKYPDPKKIAKDMNFDNYDALTQYMKDKNYRWDSQKRNYVKCTSSNQSNSDVDVDGDEDVDIDIGKKDINVFIKYLYSNRSILKRVIDTNVKGGDLPNYLITGDTSTKTIYMSTVLSDLLKGYSDEKNISQKEIVEIALVEFFKDYGYENEIEYVLK